MGTQATTATDILQRAKSLITDPRRWIGGNLEARGLDKNTCVLSRLIEDDPTHDQYVPATLDDANCFCMGLAMTKVSIDQPGPSRTIAYHVLNEAVHGTRQSGITRIGGWNDHHDTTHAQVMAAFDHAIATATVTRV